MTAEPVEQSANLTGAPIRNADRPGASQMLAQSGAAGTVRASVAKPRALNPGTPSCFGAQVLLFHAADEASLRAVTEWAERRSAAEAAPEPEIKLCVALLAPPAESPDGAPEVPPPL